VHVATRERQAVGLADRRADLDPHRQVEVADQGPDDERLLRVLLAEDRDVGPHHVQQLGDDGGDAVEMAHAAVLALERLGQPAHVDRGREARRIDLVGRGREEQVGADLGHERGVALLGARVGGEVAGVVELRRVDEERHHDHVARRTSVADEAQVPLVQRAHRRHEADDALLAPRRAQGLAQLRDGAYGPHAAATTRVASAMTS
jgi:hypothetical protein